MPAFHAQMPFDRVEDYGIRRDRYGKDRTVGQADVAGFDQIVRHRILPAKTTTAPPTTSQIQNRAFREPPKSSSRSNACPDCCLQASMSWHCALLERIIGLTARLTAPAIAVGKLVRIETSSALTSVRIWRFASRTACTSVTRSIVFSSKSVGSGVAAIGAIGATAGGDIVALTFSSRFRWSSSGMGDAVVVIGIGGMV